MRQTGGTSLSEALTKGDLDIHVRVPAEDFASARDALAQIYERYCLEMWTPGFATFVMPNAPIPTGVAPTAIGSGHDRRFVAAWERLAREPRLLCEYNTLKRKHEGTANYEGYRAEKSAFFTRITKES